MTHVPGKYAFRSLSDGQILAHLKSTVARDRSSTVELLVLLDLAERRKLHRGVGFDSMYEYCRVEHRMSDDVAYHRLRAARAARRHPVILEMIEDGRLTVTGARLLSRRLTPANATELIEAAVGRSLREIREMLALRFPSDDVTTCRLGWCRWAEGLQRQGPLRSRQATGRRSWVPTRRVSRRVHAHRRALHPYRYG